MLITQVVVLVVLLVLASVLQSPLYPDSRQIDGSDACPRPELFQAWMIVQIFRLTVCWSVSCWVAVRAQRALRRDDQAVNQEAAPSVPRYVFSRAVAVALSEADPDLVLHRGIDMRLP